MQSRVVVANIDQIPAVAKALTSELRVRILALLIEKVMNVNQIAVALGIPQSTAATSVRILENAGLIATELKPATKGAQKLCRSAAHDILLSLSTPISDLDKNVVEIEMPVGLYADFEVGEPCGLVSDTGVIGYYDHPASFLDPHRATAQLVWFSRGHLEYRFPKNTRPGQIVRTLSISAEVCSEFPGSRADWPSDILVWINGVAIGSWTSPGDMGDRRGVFTPQWWQLGDTQYGFLKTWKVTGDGSYVDGVRVSDVTVGDLHIEESEHIATCIGVKEDSINCGGLNLFGHAFGNYDRGLTLRLELAQSE